LTLPYNATLDSGNSVTDFSVMDSGYYAVGIAGGGGTTGVIGQGTQSESTGMQGTAGVGGPGVVGNGGQIDYYWQWSGPGGQFNGGGTVGDGYSGGDGLRALPGDGIGIIAYNTCTASLDYYYEVDCPPVHGGLAGLFDGYVQITGNLSKAGGSFEIDDPVDPANKYLYHSFVESPDMMNIYNGNVTTDGAGNAVVTLPEWFEALNRDFRYQLTVIGQFAQAIVASKMNHNSFAIRTDKPNVEVSWMVTGIRQDAWANAHRIPVEVDKPEADRGHYLHPELFDHAGEASIPALHHPRPELKKQ
jgi:hypothetical protein